MDDPSPGADKNFTTDMTARDPDMSQAGLNAASSLLRDVPGVVVSGSAALTGCDSITGQTEGPLARAFDAFNALAPFLKWLHYCEDG